jgi:hypothetical protein
MPRSVAFLFIVSGVALWVVAMVFALDIDTEGLTDLLTEKLQTVDPVVGGSVAAGAVVALLVGWLVFRPKPIRRHRR